MDFPPESNPQRDPIQSDLARPRPTEFNRVTMGELEQRCRDLRTLLNSALVALIVLSFAVNLFLGKQMRMIRAKVTESRPIIQRMQAEFQRKEPNMRNFVSALQSFATTSPDFQPVLIRYRQVVPQYFSSSIAVGSPLQSAPVPSNPAIGQPPPNNGRPAGAK